MLLPLVLLACRPEPDDAAEAEAEAEEVAWTTPAEAELGTACGPLEAPGAGRALDFDGPPPGNLVIISIDTLRRDRVGRYSGGDDTPFLDSRLGTGVALDDLMACANWTLPGVFCAVTGRSMGEAGMEPIDPARLEEDGYFPDEMGTLAGWLAEEGWATALVTTSKLFSDALPTGRGYEAVTFDSDMDAAAVATAARTSMSALRERAGDGGRWYLQVHFRDPHGPYSPPPGYQGDLAGADLSPLDPRTSEGIRAIFGAGEAEAAAVVDEIEALYAGELRYLDDELRALWADWEADGVLDDALVVFWSDHGEQFFEHGGFQHGTSLHQEEARAVGGFWAKNLTPLAFGGPSLLTDIPATLLDLYGIVPDASITGVPLGALGAGRARGTVARDKDLVPLLSVDRGGHRLLYGWDGARAYYQTPDDPLEAIDRYDAEDSEVGCLWDVMLPLIESIDDSGVGPAVEPGP